MKKTAVLLAIALVLGFSLAAYAGATKYPLTQGDAANGTESGFVVVNFPKEGKAIGQFQVRGLAPGDYYAYYKEKGKASVVIGKIKVNQSGSGHFHAMTDEMERPSEGWVWLGIANRESPPPTSDEVILYTKVFWP